MRLLLPDRQGLQRLTLLRLGLLLLKNPEPHTDMNATYEKGAALAAAGKLGELQKLIKETQKTDVVTAIAMGRLIESAIHNLGKR